MKTLIVYSSQYGFTKRCAKRLASDLGGMVDVLEIGYIGLPNITTYDQIIIGTPIYMGQIDSRIKTFCDKKLEQLLEKNVGIFVCCVRLDRIEEVLGVAFPKELIIKARGVEVLGGEIKAGNLSWYHECIIYVADKFLVGERDKRKEPGLIYRNHGKLLRVMNE